VQILDPTCMTLLVSIEAIGNIVDVQRSGSKIESGFGIKSGTSRPNVLVSNSHKFLFVAHSLGYALTTRFETRFSEF
jgi:hypothetical protein